MKYTEVNIKDILLSGKGFDDYLVSFPPEDPSVTASVRQIGIITPPVLLASAKGKYKVVCGRKKTAAWKKLGKKKITAKVFERGELDDRTAVLTAVTENAVSRGLNAVETSLALHKLQKFSVPVDQTVLKLLAVPVHLVLEYAALWPLETNIKKAVVEGVLTPAHAFLLAKLERDDRKTLGDLLIRKIKPNINETREIVQYLDDLKITFSKKTMRDLLALHGPAQILADDDLNPRGKVDRLRDCLRRLRYPLISEKEGCFRQKLKETGLPHNVSLSHSKYFEGNELKIECRVKTAEELKNILAKLAENDSQIRELLRIIKE